MPTGGYAIGPFRTGGSQSSDTEVILNALNTVRGTAYNADPGTIVWVENMAIARTLADAWGTARRFANQFIPAKMTVYLSRWEKIFGISPLQSETLTERRNTVAAKFEAFNVAPLTQNVKDFIDSIMSDVFIDLLHVPSQYSTGYVEGGTTISGGVTLLDGSWSSNIAYVGVRLYQPLHMTDAQFYDTANKFRPHLDAFLPAWTTFNWGRFSVADGYISIPANTTTVTGINTYFLTTLQGPLTAGEKIEVFDDNGVVHTFTMATIADDSDATVTTVIDTNITNQSYRRFGFFLDRINLDNAFLSA